MTYISRLCLAGALMGSAFAQSAIAQTAIAQFDVTITIENACTIVSASALDFGTVGTLTDNHDGTSDIVVHCTEGASYAIALDAGQGGGTPGARVMAGAGDTVSYQLYTDSGRSIVWGESPDDVSSTGNGTEQTFTVYGQVPPQDTPPAATYTDTVGVTVTF